MTKKYRAQRGKGDHPSRPMARTLPKSKNGVRSNALPRAK